MPLPLDREKTRQLTEELETIIAAHLGWFKQFNRQLVCGELSDDSLIAPDAHLTSPFGQWYHGKKPHPLADHLIFQDMAALQLALHDTARQALHTIRNGSRPSDSLHDQCLDLALRLNNKLRHLQLEIIGDLLSTDSLTGCYTRRGMLGRLQAEQERALRIQRPCTLCLIDFDRFKRINDELGHPAGDAVLKQGTHYIASALRKYDLVFRYGGEEFLICLPGTPVNDAAQVIERIRIGLANLPIALPDQSRLQVTASFGLAEVMPYKPIEDSIAQADQALLCAKQNGRNRVEMWQAALPHMAT